MPCFVLDSDLLQGWVCLLEDEHDEVGYRFITAGGMPPYLSAHSSRTGHYHPWRLHMEAEGIRFEEVNREGVLFSLATEDANDDDAE